MYTVDITKLTQCERQELFRSLFDTFPQAMKRSEALRLKRISDNKPTYIIDTGDVMYQAYSVVGIQRIIENITGKKADASNIYKALKTNDRKIFGIKIQRVYEGDKQWDV